MTRINDHLLVQRADDHIVIRDESTGAEVEFHVDTGPAVISALTYLTGAFV